DERRLRGRLAWRIHEQSRGCGGLTRLARRGSGKPPLAQKLQNDLTPVRAGTVLGNIDTLPCSQRQPAVDHRNMQANTSKHRFDMRGHVIGALAVVSPSGTLRR